MKEIDYPELAPLAKGGSIQLVISTIYYAHLLRYSTADQLKELTKSVKIATKKKLQYLQETGYLIINDGIITTTVKTLNLLIKEGYNPKLLPPPATGKGVEIYNSAHITKLIQLPFYKAILFPQFQYLIPDGLLILQDGDRYQLNFLEVERKKPDWENYLMNKREGYERLARDEKVYRYWNKYSEYLDLKCPPIEDFCFQVLCLGAEHKSWRGWIFGIENLEGGL